MKTLLISWQFNCFIGLFICLFYVQATLGIVKTAPSIRSESSCQDMLENFAYFSANFTYCAIRHARPIKVCELCLAAYMDVQKVYQDILNLRDSGGGMCRDQLTNLDHLQVVDSGFNYVNKLWLRASCDSCYKLDPSQKKPQLISSVKELLNVSAELDLCVTDHRNTTLFPDTITCNSCSLHYQRLNVLYNNMKASTGDINFCMDIIDLMNTTRFDWSTKIGCCVDRKKPEITFIISSIGVFVLSAVFYLLAFIFTGRRESPLVPQNRWRETFEKHRHPSSSTSH